MFAALFLSISLYGSTLPLEQLPVNTFQVQPLGQQRFLVWSHRYQITWLGMQDYEAWLQFWTVNNADGTWSITVPEEATKLVFKATVSDPLLIRRDVHFDRFGYERDP